MKRILAALFLLASSPALAQFNPGVPNGGGASGGGGGGGGGPVTVANGADATQGSTIDGPCPSPATTAACTAIAVMKAIQNATAGPTPAGTNVIGALVANQSVNVTQFGGSAVATGTGAGGAGVPRVTVSSDSFPASQPVTNAGTFAVQNTAALPTGSNVIGALVANQSVNNAQVAGVTTPVGNGASGTGTQRVNIANDNAPLAAAQSTATTTMATAAPTAGTFATILTANAARKACFIQNTSTSVAYVYPSATGTATTANSIQLAVGQGFSCTNNNVTMTDPVIATCGSGTCGFVISSQ